ncbi:MAG: DUF1684 domain-containing protein [Hymenobacteraceae bacterium]|nr:DUF1684 domain-containing protein [Hymenobacteraceae bacterium]
MAFQPSQSRWLLLTLLALTLILWYALHQSAPADVASSLAPDYAAERAAKDSVWRTAPDSPLPDSLKSRFRGLTYFAPSDSFRVVATYTALSTLQPLLVPLTHRAAPEPYVRVGRLQFVLNGRSCSLTALRRPAELATAALFVPFTDGTTGRTTYGGGRYLNLPAPAVDQATVTLDFNLAYAPTCAHVPDYECPVPPKENALPVAVRAGER